MKRQLLIATALAGGVVMMASPTVKADELSDLKAEMASMREEMRALKAQVSATAAPAAAPTAAPGTAPTAAPVIAQNSATPLGLVASKPPGPTPLVINGIPLVSTSNTAIYLGGIFDAGYRIDGGTRQNSIQSINSGESYGSRLTLEGYQELGYGLRAVMAIEGGLGLNNGTGASNPPNVPAGAFSFGRYSAVGLGSDDLGYVTFGRQYTPIWAVSAGGGNDPFGGFFFGGINTIYSTTIHASNAVVYSYGYSWETMLDPAPLKGFGFSAMYSTGQSTTPSPEDSGSEFGAAISYGGDGTWWLGYGYHQVSGSNSTISATAPVASTPILRQHTVGASYDLGFARLFTGVNMGSNGNFNAATGGVNSKAWDVGAKVPLTPVQQVRFLYGMRYDQTNAKADLSTAQLSYEYKLYPPAWGSYKSDLTLYAAIGFIDNSPGATAALGGAIGTVLPGALAKSFITGFRYVF
jgi:predicted porin